MITFQQAHELFNYDADTGIITNKSARGSRAKAGEEAGSPDAHGYVIICANRKRYKAHRLAILMSTGSFPAEYTDHINGIKDDNRLVNLREVSAQENQRNRSHGRNNTSGVTGVVWNKSAGKWCAGIAVSGKQMHLGSYEDWFEAVCARKSAEVRFGFHVNHGRTG